MSVHCARYWSNSPEADGYSRCNLKMSAYFSSQLPPTVSHNALHSAAAPFPPTSIYRQPEFCVIFLREDLTYHRMLYMFEQNTKIQFRCQRNVYTKTNKCIYAYIDQADLIF